MRLRAVCQDNSAILRLASASIYPALETTIAPIIDTVILEKARGYATSVAAMTALAPTRNFAKIINVPEFVARAMNLHVQQLNIVTRGIVAWTNALRMQIVSAKI